MAVLLRKRSETPVGAPVAGMIDVVFLLLIYFMVSATIHRQEADIAFQLPGTSETAEPIDAPDEQFIEISAEGQATVNGYPYDSPAAVRYGELAAMLSRFRQACDASRIEAAVTIAPDSATPHQMIIRVMDACARAGIAAVSFALGEDE
jgi:biopolymer transport protein ExbD